MGHVYGLDAAAESLLAGAVARVRAVAEPHAADVDARGRFPEESVAALAQGGAARPLRRQGARRPRPGARAPSAPSSRSSRRACGSTAMVYVMHVTAAQAIASSTTLAANGRRSCKAIAAGKHLTTLALLGEGLALAVLGAGLEADRRGRRLHDERAEVVGDLGGDRPTPTSRARRRRARSRRSSRRSTSCARARRASAASGSFDGLGLRGNDSRPGRARGPGGREGRPPHRARQGRRRHAAGGAARGSRSAPRPWRTGCAAPRSPRPRSTSPRRASSTRARKLRDLPTLRARLAADERAHRAVARAPRRAPLASMTKPGARRRRCSCC